VGEEVLVRRGKWKGRSVNMVRKKSVHMYVNAKMIAVETTPEVSLGDKGEWWRG
jgi:hypothetical protein